LAAGQNVTSDANGKPQNVQVVTLLVAPDESQKLALASVDGRIQLALRNPLDLARVNPAAVRRESLYGSSSAPAETTPKPAPTRIPAPKAPAPAPHVVVVTQRVTEPVIAPPEKLELQLIEGSKTQKVTFEKKADSAPGPQASER